MCVTTCRPYWQIKFHVKCLSKLITLEKYAQQRNQYHMRYQSDLIDHKNQFTTIRGSIHPRVHRRTCSIFRINNRYRQVFRIGRVSKCDKNVTEQSQSSSFTHICWLRVPEMPETINTYCQQHTATRTSYVLPVLFLAPIPVVYSTPLAAAVTANY